MILKEPRRRVIIHDLTLSEFVAEPEFNHYRFLAPGEKGGEKEFKPVFSALDSLYGPGTRSPLMLPGTDGRLFSREWRSFPLLERWPWPFADADFHHVHAWYNAHQRLDGMYAPLDLCDASTDRLRYRTSREFLTIGGLVVLPLARRELETYKRGARALYG
jgi:hypothetical protein